MATLVLDTLTDGTEAYDQRTELDGIEWIFTFKWNGRRQRWSFSINALDGTAVLTGQTVSLNIPLNRRQVAGPPGILCAVSEVADDFEPPGLTDLGARIKLLYIEAAGAS